MVGKRMAEISGKSLNKCLINGKNSSGLKNALSTWRTEWEDAVLEDSEDEYAKDLIKMVDKLVQKLL